MSSTRDVGKALAGAAPAVGAALAAVPEDQWFDRKSARISPRELANVEIGFANADGGVIVIGIHDGVIEGTDASPAHRNALSISANPPCRHAHGS
jgi:ATP-dependent DNA helicase RecG